MSREKKKLSDMFVTGFWCSAVVIGLAALVFCASLAGVASQPKQVMAETSEQEIR